MAGIEASTMTSLGTCRLVMPLSELTMASAGRGGVDRLDVGFDLRLLSAGRALMRAYRSPMPLFRLKPICSSTSACLARTSL